jgi:uracil-DNA glycosylase
MRKRLVEQLSEPWFDQLEQEFQAKYIQALQAFVKSDRRQGPVFPPKEETFFAYRSTPFNKVKVVILGQDPYHGPGQAHGLAFSTRADPPFPPSLKNIFRELKEDIGSEAPVSGDLTQWAKEGVLLLNTSLTVKKATPASHAGKGWEKFTDASIKALSANRERLVFMLWGRHAQAKGNLIDPAKHLILEAAHPSPFSAHKGFFGCKHFTKANAYLKDPINWELK